MAAIRASEPVKLCFSVLTGFPSLAEDLRPRLEKKWGPVESESPLFPIAAVPDELREMGDDIYRKFFALRRCVDPMVLADAKIWSLDEEEKVRRGGRTRSERPLDIDAGYVTLSKVVLAFTRDLSHRIAVGKGIYASVILKWRSNLFGAAEDTPESYRDRRFSEFLAVPRRSLADQIAKRETT